MVVCHPIPPINLPGHPMPPVDGDPRVNDNISSSNQLNRLEGEASTNSSDCPPPATLVHAANEDSDEELELPHLEQEESTPPLQNRPPKKQKTGKKRKPDDESPESSPPNVQSIYRCNPIVRMNSSLTSQLTEKHDNAD